jgi:putative membrane protein
MPAPPVVDATHLAVERTQLAQERTLMAWVRTATSLISFGFTIYKFFEYAIESKLVVRREGLFSPRDYAMTMITIGLASLSLALVEHVRSRRALRRAGADVPLSLSAVTALFVALLGIAGLVMAFLGK